MQLFLSTAVSGSDSGSGVIFVDSSEFETVDLEGVRQTRASSSSDSLSKAVSSNITNILESLLKNYDKTERPSFQNGEPTKVNVNILIRSMGPISEMQMVRLGDHEQTIKNPFQYYSMDCYFRQYWRDQRLSFKGLKNNANNLVINQLREASFKGQMVIDWTKQLFGHILIKNNFFKKNIKNEHK